MSRELRGVGESPRMEEGKRELQGQHPRCRNQLGTLPEQEAITDKFLWKD